MPMLEWKENSTPRSLVFDDIYYAKEGGLEESRYVFVEQNQLPEKFKEASHFSIGELGFGTGLNAVLTAKLFQDLNPNQGELHFYSCEKFPLAKKDIEKALSAWPELKAQASHLLGQYPEFPTESLTLSFNQSICIHLFIGDVLDFFEDLPMIDAWYFDGFSPKKNPQMWSTKVFSKAASRSRPSASFATYASAGKVRRALTEVGFHVQKHPGFGFKREMLKGYYGG